MISVVIRNKNEAPALEFLLKNLTQRYANDIDEIIVLDNLSTDNSEEIAKRYGAEFVTIEKFSFGGSANLAASKAKNKIVVIFSAHSYPVSHDFFKLIQQKFIEKPSIAGIRCLHQPNDYKNFINGIKASEDPNKSGLIFAGSAFNREIWQKIPFKEEVATFEDKEWTVRVLKAGYEIEIVPAIFCYDVKRTPAQLFFRFKNDVVGNYQLWHQEVTWRNIFNKTLMSLIKLVQSFFVELYYIVKRFVFLVRFVTNKPKKF
ncbi:glycosyltransferase [Flavobacterium luminosum]|uniref:Glycosyltransferase n=1 Tax=Flavobacterium luminosum TaxID=2949086 RepID=A0ABT0TNN6_9FLAO|nr:glycosyltransferase [Flavobacterium sp. HXWNR70]MCL9809090.1 glycosyltransferase [Flavobacterium sp. HXWNR70]